jgi:hypothetical protein
VWSIAYVPISRLNQNGSRRDAEPAGSMTIWRATMTSSTSVPSSSRGSTALIARPSGAETATVSVMMSATAPWRTSGWSKRIRRRYGTAIATPTVHSARSRPPNRCQVR